MVSCYDSSEGSFEELKEVGRNKGEVEIQKKRNDVLHICCKIHFSKYFYNISLE